MKEIAGKQNQNILRERLISLSAEGLERMFDPDEGLFCNRSIRAGDRIVNEGRCVRYTIISLLGLHRFELSGGRSPVDIGAVLPGLYERVKKDREIGDTGLLIWLLALADPGSVQRRLRGLDIESLWDAYRGSGKAGTMELSWLLTGLSLTARASRGGFSYLAALADGIYETIRRNYGGRGIFGHQGSGTLAGRIRGRFGSFADQVYPIYALSFYGDIFGKREALGTALDCAEQICRLQGSQGQWWWHYDRATGRVLGRYPVYSVHQDGMAPMALYAVGRATGADFSRYIDRGLEWITGKNELGQDLIDSRRKLIWRSFYQSRQKKYIERAAALLNLERTERPNDLNVLYECRPYHLGWLLYAFA